MREEQRVVKGLLHMLIEWCCRTVYICPIHKSESCKGLILLYVNYTIIKHIFTKDVLSFSLDVSLIPIMCALNLTPHCAL